MTTITKSTHPAFYAALRAVDADNGMDGADGQGAYNLTVRADVARRADAALTEAALTADEFETFIMGGDDDVEFIAARHGLTAVSLLIDTYFNGQC